MKGSICGWCNVQHKYPLSASVKAKHAHLTKLSKRTIPPGGDRYSRRGR